MSLLLGLALLPVPPGLANPTSATPAGVGGVPTPTRPPAKGLTSDQQAVADASVKAVRSDLEGFIARYLTLVTTVRNPQGQVIQPGTRTLAEAMARGPLLISPDDAKELFAAYSVDLRSRSVYADAVRQASSLIIDALWSRALAQPSPMGRNAVLLLGGGVASGKTTAIRSNPEVLRLMSQVALVRESTLSSLERSAAHVAQARAAGRPVQILYVYAPIEVAVQRLVDRGMREGRAVPSQAVARSHWDSQHTVLELAARYRQDPQVRFNVLLSGNGDPPTLLPIDALAQRRWSNTGLQDSASFQRDVQELVQNEIRRRFLDAHPADPSPQLRRELQR